MKFTLVLLVSIMISGCLSLESASKRNLNHINTEKSIETKVYTRQFIKKSVVGGKNVTYTVVVNVSAKTVIKLGKSGYEQLVKGTLKSLANNNRIKCVSYLQGDYTKSPIMKFATNEDIVILTHRHANNQGKCSILHNVRKNIFKGEIEDTLLASLLLNSLRSKQFVSLLD